MTEATRHEWDGNPESLDAAELFDDMIHITGIGNNPFPGPLTRAELRLSAENSQLTAEVMQLKAELELQKEAAEFWYQMYSKRFDKKERAK